MSKPLPAWELRPLLRDALMAKQPELLDEVMVTLVTDLGQKAEYIEPFAVEALESVPPEVRAFWQEPCDCQVQMPAQP